MDEVFEGIGLRVPAARWFWNTAHTRTIATPGGQENALGPAGQAVDQRLGGGPPRPPPAEGAVVVSTATGSVTV